MGSNLSGQELTKGKQTEGGSSPEPVPIPANMKTNNLLKRLLKDMDTFKEEIESLNKEKEKSRQYVDMRLKEVEARLRLYNKARDEKFKQKTPETAETPTADASKRSLTDQLEKQGKEPMHTVEQLNDKINEQKQTIKKLEERNKDLTLRLSKIVGEKLVKDNPHIADLSDPNRPTKLAEIYSELYDNEYTDTIEQLTKRGIKQEESIQILRQTLLSTYDFCKKTSEGLIETVEHAVLDLFKEYKQTILSVSQNQKINPKTFYSPNEMYLWSAWRRQPLDGDSAAEKLMATFIAQASNIDIEDKLKQLRKDVSLTLLPMVQKAYLKARWDKSCIPALKPFIQKCLLVTWCMVVQSPPLVFMPSEDKVGSKFDNNIYRAFTAIGNSIDYVVWPALCICEGGALLSKGVAQGRKD